MRAFSVKMCMYDTLCPESFLPFMDYPAGKNKFLTKGQAMDKARDWAELELECIMESGQREDCKLIERDGLIMVAVVDEEGNTVPVTEYFTVQRKE